MRGYLKTTAALLFAAASAWLGWQLSANAGQHITNKSLLVQQSGDQNAQRMDQMHHQSGSSGMNQSSPQGSMGQQQQGAALPQGVSQKNLGDFDDVRKNFATFAKDALKRDGFKDLTDNFVESDRNRLSGGAGQNVDTWNNAIDQFNNAWKAKYNKEFDVPDRNQAYSDRFLSVTQGQVDDPKQIQNWPVAPMQEAAQNWQKLSASPNIQKGTQVAVVTLTGQANEKPLNASLIREGSNWKIDIPDSVSADDLRASLARHLGEVTNMKDQWPSDPNDAARIVTYHLLMACYSAGQAGQGMSTSGQQPGQQPGQQHGQQPGQQHGQQPGQQQGQQPGQQHGQQQGAQQGQQHDQQHGQQQGSQPGQSGASSSQSGSTQSGQNATTSSQSGSTQSGQNATTSTQSSSTNDQSSDQNDETQE